MQRWLMLTVSFGLKLKKLIVDDEAERGRLEIRNPNPPQRTDMGLGEERSRSAARRQPNGRVKCRHGGQTREQMNRRRPLTWEKVSAEVKERQRFPEHQEQSWTGLSSVFQRSERLAELPLPVLFPCVAAQ